MNTAEKIAVMQAHLDGKIIQCRYINGNDTWDDQDSANLLFDSFANVEYRVKPKPETLEDRVKAEYPDYEVVMLDYGPDKIYGLERFGTFYPYSICEAMLGFFEHVFELDGALVADERKRIIEHRGSIQIWNLPIAALFTRGEG